jgi:hypothetical protein
MRRLPILSLACGERTLLDLRPAGQNGWPSPMVYIRFFFCWLGDVMTQPDRTFQFRTREMALGTQM